MNNRLLGIILSLLVLFIAGCTNSNEHPRGEDDLQGHSRNEGKASDPKPSAPSVVADLKIEGDIKNIYYADKNKVLIAADKLYLYDPDTENVWKESTREKYERENVWVVDSGYVAVREYFGNDQSESSQSMMTGGGSSYKVMFYDHDLNTVSEFDLNQLFEGDDTLMSLNSISFSTTGTQVAYATYSGLYIYDFKKKSKNTVIDLASGDIGDRSGIVNIEQIGFTHEDKSIAFKAQSFDVPIDPEKPSFDTCGIVHIDGSGLMNKTFDNYTCKKITAYHHHLLFTEDPTVSSGRTLVMDIPSNKTKIHKQVEKGESGNVWGSNDGGYFATSVPNKSGWKVRVYNTKTGELTAEQQVSSDGESRYMEHDPIIKVIDKTRTCIVLLGAIRDDIKTKMMVSQF